MPVRIHWGDLPIEVRAVDKHGRSIKQVEPLEKIAAAQAIATWDPEWRDHAWDVELTFTAHQAVEYRFSYKKLETTKWLDGPIAYDYTEFDLEFRKWYEETFPLPKNWKRWEPTCDYCGETYALREYNAGKPHHAKHCIGRWAFAIDTRWAYPYSVFPSTMNERYHREKEVLAEIEEYGFRIPRHHGNPIYWKHLLQPSEEVLLKAGYLYTGEPAWWVKYWVDREVARALKPYSRIKHIKMREGSGLGYSYYGRTGSLACSVRKIDGLWYVFTSRREKLPHGFRDRDHAVAFYYPYPGTMLDLVRRYVHESKWPIVRSKTYKRLKSLPLAA